MQLPEILILALKQDLLKIHRPPKKDVQLDHTRDLPRHSDLWAATCHLPLKLTSLSSSFLSLKPFHVVVAPSAPLSLAPHIPMYNALSCKQRQLEDLKWSKSQLCLLGRKTGLASLSQLSPPTNHLCQAAPSWNLPAVRNPFPGGPSSSMAWL